MASPTIEQNSGIAFRLLFLTIFIDLLGFGIIIPILPTLVQEIDPAREGVLLGYLLASYSLAQFIFAPMWGRISDRVGRRPIILIGLIGSSIGFGLFGVVRTYEWYLISRIIAGIFTGASLPTARAYVADITPPVDRARRFGLLGAAFGIGFTFGPAIGSLLNNVDIPGLPRQAASSLFAAILALVNFVLAYRRLPESLQEKDHTQLDALPTRGNVSRFMEFFSFPGVLILLVIFGIITLVFSGFESMFQLFAENVDSRVNDRNIGYFFAFIGILVAFFQSSVVGPAVARFGEERTIIIGLVFSVIGFLLLSMATNIFTMILFIAPLGLGQALVTPTINSSISNRIPDDQQGGGLGINSSVGSLGRVFGPLYGGYFYDNVGPASPFQIGAVVIFLVAIATYFMLKPVKSLTEKAT